ncbi:MAG: efflux RND transporter permease subunit [Alphaproteobacteria bacterium]|nr:efflux RND transporter permease subunit [Alphaproteobacteria bacterium]
MNIIELSIKRPVFITSVMLTIIATGLICFRNIAVDLFPDINIPIIFISTTYKGASPAEIEMLVSKPIEDRISTVSGIKRLSSRSLKDTSQIIVTLFSGVDIKYAEQQIRDKINQVRGVLPDDIEEPVIRRIDPSDQPVITFALTANLSEAQLFDLADSYIRPRVEQVQNVGMVEILGARKREIHVLLDQKKLIDRQISLSQASVQLAKSGKNVSIGRMNEGEREQIFRSASEFNDIDQIKNTIISFYGNEVPTRISDLGEVVDTLTDEKSRAFINGKKSLFINVYRQSDANIIKVVDGVKAQIKKMEGSFSSVDGKPEIMIFKDASKYILNNIKDIYKTITIAIILTVLTVFFFLANSRATLITTISLPISLIGSFILLYVAGFSINVISLLALSLAVGLLVDDAIVVVENIYRKIDHGIAPKEAAVAASKEIMMAVVAISAVVISVFTPLSFMGGIVGQYLKQFGLTISFAMLISLFVAISIIPMLCAYLSGKRSHHLNQSKLLKKFDEFQRFLEVKYEKIIRFSIANPKKILLATLAFLVLSIITFKFVPKTFLADNNNGELSITLELSADMSLDTTTKAMLAIEQIIRANPEVELSASTSGSGSSQSNRGEIYIKLKPGEIRKITTTAFKDKLRTQLKDFAYANPIIKDYDPSGVSYGQPFNLLLISTNQNALNDYAAKVLAELKKDSRLKDVDISNKATRNEFRVRVKDEAAEKYGVNPQVLGDELRGYVEGYTPTKLRQNDLEYDVRLRLKPEQRHLRENFGKTYIPNINQRMIKLSDVAQPQEGLESAVITRMDRGRYIQLNASMNSGAGLGDVMSDVEAKFRGTSEITMPSDIRYIFVGDSENMQDMQSSMLTAIFAAILFIYLILTSLYESFIIPFTILLALPLALCGASYSLFICHESVNIFAMLGIFMLISISGKNSILLIDFTNHLIEQGKSRSEALIEAGKMRLRPILMTSFALIFGTLPVAIGVSETGPQRTAMGVAIIGGLISSTILTLVVVPAVFSYIDRFRIWAKNRLSWLVS